MTVRFYRPSPTLTSSTCACLYPRVFAHFAQPGLCDHDDPLLSRRLGPLRDVPSRSSCQSVRPSPAQQLISICSGWTVVSRPPETRPRRRPACVRRESDPAAASPLVRAWLFSAKFSRNGPAGPHRPERPTPSSPDHCVSLMMFHPHPKMFPPPLASAATRRYSRAGSTGPNLPPRNQRYSPQSPLPTPRRCDGWATPAGAKKQSE